MQETIVISGRVKPETKNKMEELVRKLRYRSNADFVNQAIEHYIQKLQQEA